MIPRSTIHKQKRKFFALVSVLSCLPPPTLIFHETIPRFLKSSSKKYSRGTRRSSSSWSNWKKWQSYIGLSMQLRRLERKQRKRLRRKLKGSELWRRRRERGGWWSTSNSSETRCQRKKLPYWNRLKDSRSWDPNVRSSPLETRRNNGPPRRLKGSNKRSTMGALLWQLLDTKSNSYTSK